MELGSKELSLNIQGHIIVLRCHHLAGLEQGPPGEGVLWIELCI